MRPIPLIITAALFLSLLSTDGLANPPIALTDCETITHRGNYILENDLVLTATSPDSGYGGAGNCLVINASHVHLNLNGQEIIATCPDGLCDPENGPVGEIGIDVMSGADHVSISNGSVGGFVYGIVGEADHIYVSNLHLFAVLGVTLTDVSYSAFTDIAFEGADIRYHGANGPILYLSGGGENIFTNISGLVGSDMGGPYGAEILNSNANLISDMNIRNTSCGGTNILLSDGSSFNIVTNSMLFDECGGGIEVGAGSSHNSFMGNTVTIASPSDIFAMLDENPDCGSNVWTDNTFSNIFLPGEISASPASCIH
jgi:hypothetical protein